MLLNEIRQVTMSVERLIWAPETQWRPGSRLKLAKLG